MNRRRFLGGATAGAVISTLDWLAYFRQWGVPGTRKSLGLAEAAAQATAPAPRFLIYWFQEGGWDGYSMFNPLDTPNHAALSIPAGTLNPNPSWSSQRYRPRNYGTAPLDPPKTQGNITYGYLAQDGLSLFPDLAVVSSHKGNTFHSGGRFEYHYGKYNMSMSNPRAADERTVMQAFCEAYGANKVLPHVSWHRWLSDGELSLASYPDGTGYYENLGPAYAHTQYGKTPADLRARLMTVGNVAANVRNSRIRQFVDNLNSNFTRDKEGESVRAFQSAVQTHQSLVGGTGPVLDPSKLFNDPALRAEFNVTAADEETSSRSINGNLARSKDSPNTNVQALMTYELMTKGLSIGFWIENRSLRLYDTHWDRRGIMGNRGQQDQRNELAKNLWTPLQTLVSKLKNTPFGATGKSYYDFTTIVLASEMGRTIEGNVDTILASADPDAEKYEQVMTQDTCSHWHVGSCAFLGGTVRGNTQWGRVGISTLQSIPILPSGELDPAFDPVTGELRPGLNKDANSVVTDAGHVYATALALSGLDPVALTGSGHGRNTRPPLAFIKK